MVMTDIRAKKGNSALMVLKTFPNFLISGRNLRAVASRRIENSDTERDGQLQFGDLAWGHIRPEISFRVGTKLTCIPTLVDLNPSSSRMANVLWDTGLQAQTPSLI